MKFEYTTTYKSIKDLNDSGGKVKFLNQMGDKGWELCGVETGYFINNPHLPCNYTFYWKRTIL